MPSLMRNPDFLRPIGDGNRDEVMVVPFHRILKNTNMSLLLNILEALSADPDLMPLFPGIAAYTKLSVDDMYNATVLYNSKRDLVHELSHGLLSLHRSQDFANAFSEPYNLQNLHLTRLELVLKRLLTASFIKEIYFVADKMTTEMIQYLGYIFTPEDLNKRVFAIQCDYLELLQEKPEITTIFLDSSKDFFRIYAVDKNLLQDKYVVIGESYFDIESDPSGKKGAVKLAHLKVFKELKEQKICVASYMYPQCLIT